MRELGIGEMIEIVGVQAADLDAELLDGGSIDSPAPGSRVRGRSLVIEGWALARRDRVVAVEILHGGRSICRARIGAKRADVAAAHPGQERAEFSGFRARLAVADLTQAEFHLQAVLADQSRAPLGSIRLRSAWGSDRSRRAPPLVSIVVPCFDQAGFLGEAIESVLEQDHPRTEVVVIDDGSRDNTEEVAARYPGVLCVRQTNRGVSAARNLGLSLSCGDFVVFVDADDRLLPGALSAGASRLEARPDLSLVIGRCRVVGAFGMPMKTDATLQLEPDPYAAMLAGTTPRTTSSAMFRRSAIENVGGFRGAMTPAEDYDLYLRVALRHGVASHGALVSEYRSHCSSASNDSRAMLAATLSVLRTEGRGGRDRLALSAGRREWRWRYREKLIEEIRDCFRERRWWRGLNLSLATLRMDPLGILGVAGR